MRPVLLILGAALVTAACAVRADGPPEIEVDRSACSHCGMLISEPVYAAAYRVPGGEPRVFDDIGCLLNAVRREPGVAPRFWFHDASHGNWIDGEGAVFVVSSGIRTPMGGGVLAFGSADAAERAARTHEGTMVPSIADLLARPGGKS